MPFSTLNFILDLIVLGIISVFLIADKPLRVGLIVAVTVVSYLVPLTTLERWTHAPPVAQQNPAPSHDLAAGMARSAQTPGLGQTENAVETLQQVGNLLDQSTGAAPAQNLDGNVSPASGAWWNARDSSRLRYGRDLSPAAEKLVEQMWFYARMSMLFALIPFFMADGRVTLGIGCFIALPVPYLCVVGGWALGHLFPSVNLRGTQDHIPPGVFWGSVLTGLLILGYALKGWWHTRPVHSEVFVPDPALYRLQMAGHLYDFELNGTILRLHPGNIELDLTRAYSDPATPRFFQFSTGTSIEFIRRPEADTGLLTENA